jgi:hypothetical protein
VPSARRFSEDAAFPAPGAVPAGLCARPAAPGSTLVLNSGCRRCLHRRETSPGKARRALRSRWQPLPEGPTWQTQEQRPGSSARPSDAYEVRGSLERGTGFQPVASPRFARAGARACRRGDAPLTGSVWMSACRNREAHQRGRARWASERTGDPPSRWCRPSSKRSISRIGFALSQSVRWTILQARSGGALSRVSLGGRSP